MYAAPCAAVAGPALASVRFGALNVVEPELELFAVVDYGVLVPIAAATDTLPGAPGPVYWKPIVRL